MTSPCKHPTPGLWVTVALVAVLVAYPLSFGPLLRLYDRRALPRWGDSVFRTTFSPISGFISGGLQCAIQPYQAYLRLWRSRKSRGAGLIRELWVDSQCGDLWQID
jgi:hypothetical protein